jgi:sugar lactone lactonase YvrE
MRVVLDGLVMGESARWHDGRLWFCDWGAGEIIVLARDVPEVVARIDDFPFCIDWLPDGRLLVITGRGLLLRREPDGSLVTHADLTTLGGTHPWNDIAVDSRGHGTVELDRGGFACAVGDGTLYAVTAIYPSPGGAAGQLVAVDL